MIANPPPWPNGARCAVALTFDMDADSLLHVGFRDSLNRPSPLSYLRYGPTVAMPRILATYRKFGLKQTFFMPAWCMEQYPEVVEAVLDDGHEIGHHGYIHELPNAVSREEEHYWLKRSIDVIVSMTGQRPRGWRAPLYGASSHSFDLLKEEGFEYDASLMGDDIPYLVQLRNGGELIELPTHWGIDDWVQFVHSPELDYMLPIQAPSVGVQVFKEEFDAAWEYGGLLVTPWHPFVTGRLARWHQVEGFIKYMLAKGDVWFAPLEDIAHHVRHCIDEGNYQPRVETWPSYGEQADLQPNRPGHATTP
jgi:peptidoglycan/xylan/chitin deacetylase (PgdA/CDA1 family)